MPGPDMVDSSTVQITIIYSSESLLSEVTSGFSFGQATGAVEQAELYCGSRLYDMGAPGVRCGIGTVLSIWSTHPDIHLEHNIPVPFISIIQRKRSRVNEMSACCGSGEQRPCNIDICAFM